MWHGAKAFAQDGVGECHGDSVGVLSTSGVLLHYSANLFLQHSKSIVDKGNALNIVQFLQYRLT